MVRFRRTMVVVSFALALASMALPVTAQCTAPPNEDCDGAVIFDNADLPLAFDGPLGCVNDIVDKPYRDVFFRFDCACTGNYTFELCDSAGDTYIRIYTGACGWAGGAEFAVGDDECPGSPPNADPSITVSLEAGTPYWIEVGTWRPDPPWAPEEDNAPYTLVVSACTEPCPTDLDESGATDFSDILILISTWGPCAGDCPGDLDDDNITGFSDLLLLLSAWGPC